MYVRTRDFLLQKISSNCVIFLVTFFCISHNLLIWITLFLNIVSYFIYLELHDAVFVVGALDETIILRGMRYHPIDIENSVMRCHRKIAEW